MCFDTDILARNSIMKVKLKILERINLRGFFDALSAGFLIMSVACSGAEFELHYIYY